MQVDGKWGLACLDRDGDERENLLEPFELVLESGCISKCHQRRRSHGSECHELVQVHCTSDLRMTVPVSVADHDSSNKNASS